jgi:K+ transporter
MRAIHNNYPYFCFWCVDGQIHMSLIVSGVVFLVICGVASLIADYFHRNEPVHGNDVEQLARRDRKHARR